MAIGDRNVLVTYGKECRGINVALLLNFYTDESQFKHDDMSLRLQPRGVVVLARTDPGAAPLALKERWTLWTGLASKMILRKVKQTFFDSISL